MSETIDLAIELIKRASITPKDEGCQELLGSRLANNGFVVKHLPFGEVKNFWAKHGTTSPVLIFAGHTDVVPSGPVEKWTSPPFSPTIRDGHLYGRGAADMKSSIAAMVTATERFIRNHPEHQGTIAFLITSDEEGPSIDGTQKVVEYLVEQQEELTWCIVGEASSHKILGDTIKIGRRGTLSGTLHVYGVQGHIAYPAIALNPIHKALPALTELIAKQWDNGNENFQPTSLQISNFHSGTGAGNVIPGEAKIQFNFRYSPMVTAEFLQQTVEATLTEYGLKYTLEWQHSGEPFLTKSGKLLDTAINSIQKFSHVEPELSTSGGTSDGRFIAKTGCEVIEIGPINASIHQIDERINVAELENLSLLYEEILNSLLG